LRAYQWNLILAILWLFTATIQAGLHPFNVGVAFVAGIGAFIVGVVASRGTAKRIEKNGGEYRPSRRRTLFALGLGLAFGALLFYLLFSEALSLNTILQFNSVYVAVPALYFGGAVGFGMWEVRNGKEIQWEGRTWYSVPKGLSWQERYQYRNEQRNRVRTGNSGEQAANGGV
jgi:drug/metabolite transporter (DMT)-like permease